MIIMDQTGTLVMDVSGYPKVYIARSEDEADKTVPWGLFIDCYSGETETMQLGAYEDLDDAQHALKGIYVAMQSDVSVSLEGLAE